MTHDAHDTDFKYNVPGEIPPVDDAPRIVSSLAHRSTLFGTLGFERNFSDFWDALCVAGSSIEVNKELFVLRYVGISGPPNESLAEDSTLAFQSAIPTLPYITMVPGRRWLSKHELTASRLYDHRLTLTACISRKAEEFDLILPASADTMPFAEARPSWFLPVLLRCPSTVKDPAWEIIEAFGDEPIEEALEVALGMNGRIKVFINELLCTPEECVSHLFLRLRTECVMREQHARQSAPVTWQYSGVTREEFIEVNVSFGTTVAKLKLPFSAYWEPISVADMQIREMFTQLNAQELPPAPIQSPES